MSISKKALITVRLSESLRTIKCSGGGWFN